MPITDWSETIVIAELADEPAFSDDFESLMRRLDQSEETPDVIVNLQGLKQINSSNIAQLLRLRKRLNRDGRRLRVCSINNSVWTVFLVTGLDNVFEFTDDVSTSLASLQIEE